MEIHVITIFPELFTPFLETSIVGIARRKAKLRVTVHDLRDYTEDRHRTVDDRPFGGGPGMVFRPEPVFRAVEAIEAASPVPLRRVLLTPQGERLTQARVAALAREPGLLLLAGHYEGFDERVRIGLKPLEVSIGDYVLTGGELPAMVLLDAVTRLLPGVLGDARSAAEDSFSRGLLDCPHYTRPAVFRGMPVPEVLRTGDHDRIRRWRELQARERTRARRPDLLFGGGEDEKRPEEARDQHDSEERSRGPDPGH